MDLYAITTRFIVRIVRPNYINKQLQLKLPPRSDAQSASKCHANP